MLDQLSQDFPIFVSKLDDDAEELLLRRPDGMTVAGSRRAHPIQIAADLPAPALRA